MDGEFSASGLQAIGPALQGVVDAGDLSGFVTLVWRGGEVVQVDTVGRRDVAGDKPMTRDTLFRIASMTKPITSVAALMLLEEGRLKLDDPITRWAPEFSDMQVMKAADGPLDQTVPAEREITIEDLMTHRAGLAYGFTSVGPIAQAHEKALGPALGTPLTPDEWMKRLGELPLSYQPGARFHYSHATDVLGFIVARIEGKTLDQVLQDRVFGPLSMTDTAFHVPPEKLDRAARLYRINPKTDTMEEVPFPYYPAPPVFAAGGGGLVSTADDYLKFARLMLGKGEVDGVRLLKTGTVEMMTADRLTEAQKAIPFMGIPFWLGQGFGLGVSVITDPVKQAWMGAGNAGAFGWPGAFGTWWQADPAADMVLIYLIQNSIDLGPEAAAQLATGQRMGGRAALPVFQKMVYGALAG
ncbi:MAG: serine hydrolase domain-containing protein [Phenylobacterium sp.]|uniref:serine hydrolase domain-containing protein n=1 Tax=Phenylobacterium sp. TaxID=1871053 RepID=UPI002733EA8C|nr:serine hydrolase domain-containing protein [Phenylobacterium sp.]MDP3118227.1 serine hydrolase domain-containing protein [Phenylobacterium sp.]